MVNYFVLGFLKIMKPVQFLKIFLFWNKGKIKIELVWEIFYNI